MFFHSISGPTKNTIQHLGIYLRHNQTNPNDSHGKNPVCQLLRGNPSHFSGWSIPRRLCLCPYLGDRSDSRASCRHTPGQTSGSAAWLTALERNGWWPSSENGAGTLRRRSVVLGRLNLQLVGQIKCITVAWNWPQYSWRVEVLP